MQTVEILLYEYYNGRIITDITLGRVGLMHRKLIKISIFFYIIMFFVACESSKISIEEKSFIDTLTLEEKVGQLFVIRPDSIDPDLTPQEIEKNFASGVISLSEKMIAEYEKFPAGGFVLFQKNIKNPQQLKEFNEQLHGLGKIRPLIFIDEEGGRVARLANTKDFYLPKYKNMGELAAGKNEQAVYEAGITIGSYLCDYGFDVDFAPVADVNTNPKNPIIGTRAFSSDPETAGRMAMIFMEGLHNSGVLGCLKHFPGHGDTMTDSHKGYAETQKNWKELKECELLPFENGINNGVEMIMAAHITVPKVDFNGLPSTLSKIILTEKLRDELCFKGLIITDAMEMKAITSKYSDGEAAVMAIKAGADIILMPYDYRAAYKAVLKAIKKGEITEARIDESVRRILKVKN